MRAWRVTNLGEPAEVLELADMPLPEPEPNQIAVRVRAAALNFADVLMCRGTYQVRPPLPFTPGVEVCGEIVACGKDARGLSAGDRVIGMTLIPTGSLAQFTLMASSEAFAAPETFDDAEASAFFLSYQTAWFALHRRASLQPGEFLLVHAAAGGVGSAAVQLGKAAGATVIAVVGGELKGEVARSLGSDVVVNRHEEDFVEVVKEVTSGHGADVVYDAVGGNAYERSTKCIAFEGRIVLVGFAGGKVQAPALSHPLVKNYSILGLHWGLYRSRDPLAISECHDRLTQLAAKGITKPLVTERLKLEDAASGLQNIAKGMTTGRLCVVP